MRISWWHIPAALAVALSCAHADTPEQEARIAIAAGRTDAALSSIAKIDRESPAFQWGLLEGARLLYRERRWNEFFGVASYTRHSYPEAKETAALRLLESLALIRHCQFDAAAKLIAERSSKFPQLDSEYQLVSALLPVLPKIPEEKPAAKKEEAGKPKAPEKNPTLWRVKSSALAWVNPFKLRVRIVPQCEKTSTQTSTKESANVKAE